MKYNTTYIERALSESPLHFKKRVDEDTTHREMISYDVNANGRKYFVRVTDIKKGKQNTCFSIKNDEGIYLSIIINNEKLFIKNLRNLRK